MILYHFAVLLSIPFCDFFRTFEKNLFAAALTQLLYYFNVNKDMAISISEGKFNFYSTDFVKYNNTSFLVMPEKASINTNIYDGGSVTGYIAKEINVDDSTPSVAFGQEYNGTAESGSALQNNARHILKCNQKGCPKRHKKERHTVCA